MNEQQIAALRCAHADLAGVYQCAIRDGNGGADNGHDWKAHKQSILDLEKAFSDILDHIPLDDGEDEDEESTSSGEWFVISVHNGERLAGPYPDSDSALVAINTEAGLAGGVTHFVRNGVMLEIEPEDEEAINFTYFDCWSETGDETSQQYDWEDTRSIEIARELLQLWSESLNVKSIHPDVIRGAGNTFEHAYLTAGQHSDGYSNLFLQVFKELNANGYSVYASDNRIEIYPAI